MIAYRKKKCGTRYCRNAARKDRTTCPKCAQRKFRLDNPIAAAWATHCDNAKKRGIAVLWTKVEFSVWAMAHDYPNEKKKGMQIHRPRNLEGYALDNAELIPGALNAYIAGKIERWQRKRLFQQQNGDKARPLPAPLSV